MQKRIKKIIIISFVLILVVNLIGKRGAVVEELNIPNAVGYDIEEGPDASTLYSVPLRIYFSESKLQNESKLITAEGINLGETRNRRQLQSSRRFILGLEKALIVSEKAAEYGVRSIIDILLNNPQVNDNARMVVCRGKAKDIMQYEVKKFGGTEEYIGSQIEHLTQFNFFPENYTLMNFIILSTSEGKTPVLPYIDIVDDELKVIGVAIFNKDKMIKKLNIEDTKILNLLRENGGKGVLTVQKSSKEYTNYYPKANRKVKCYKEGDKYKFTIDIMLKGPIVSNELYKDLDTDPKVLKQFQKDMEEQVKEKCEKLISEIKKNYEVDVLQLGSVAAAKYGRESGVDWNKEILNSEIKVNVKVKVDSQGRGDY